MDPYAPHMLEKLEAQAVHVSMNFRLLYQSSGLSPMLVRHSTWDFATRILNNLFTMPCLI